ncbi:MAG: DNA-3-methyladenine glycosylase 2 family protein [Isosphaeraceae bacterium]
MTTRRRAHSLKSVAAESDRWADAVRHLHRVDPHLRTLIRRIGPCRLAPRPDRFGTLVNSIIGQQISAKAAASISRRLRDLTGTPHRPDQLLALGEQPLREVGLSASKARYVLNLAEAVSTGSVLLDSFNDSWDDAAIVALLSSIKGIGVWTAEMFLIFALNRPDVLPVHDLGIRTALRQCRGLAGLPRPSECFALAEAWRPYRTIASWYIWQNADTPAPKPTSDRTAPGRG